MTHVTETADCFLHGPFDAALLHCPHPDHARHERVAQELEAEVRASVAAHGDPPPLPAQREYWLAAKAAAEADHDDRLWCEATDVLKLMDTLEELREAGQALRACPFNWSSSTEAADAADAWDELEKKSNSPGTEV